LPATCSNASPDQNFPAVTEGHVLLPVLSRPPVLPCPAAALRAPRRPARCSPECPAGLGPGPEGRSRSPVVGGRGRRERAGLRPGQPPVGGAQSKVRSKVR